MKLLNTLMLGSALLALTFCKQPAPSGEETGADLKVVAPEIDQPSWGALEMTDDSAAHAYIDELVAAMASRQQAFDQIQQPSATQKMNLVFRNVYDYSFIFYYSPSANRRQQAAAALNTLLTEHGEDLKNCLFYEVYPGKYATREDDRDLTAKNPDMQLHVMPMGSDSVRRFPLVFDKLTISSKEAVVHEIGIPSDDGKYVLPVLISSNLTDHAEGGHPHSTDYVAYNLNIDPASVKYQRFRRWVDGSEHVVGAHHTLADSLKPEEEQSGKRHKTAFFHCHNPIDGRVILPEEGCVLPFAEISFAQVRFSYYNQFGGPLGGTGSNLLLALPVRPEATPQSPQYKRVQKARLVGLTFLSRAADGTLWPVRPQFFTVFPEMAP